MGLLVSITSAEMPRARNTLQIESTVNASLAVESTDLALEVKIPRIYPYRGLVHELRFEGIPADHRLALPDCTAVVDGLPLTAETGADILFRNLQGCAAVSVRGGLNHNGHLVDIAVGIQRIGGGAEGLGRGLWSRLALITVIRGIVLDLRRGDDGYCEEAEEENELFHCVEY